MGGGYAAGDIMLRSGYAVGDMSVGGGYAMGDVSFAIGYAFTMGGAHVAEARPPRPRPGRPSVERGGLPRRLESSTWRCGPSRRAAVSAGRRGFLVTQPSACLTPKKTRDA